VNGGRPIPKGGKKLGYKRRINQNPRQSGVGKSKKGMKKKETTVVRRKRWRTGNPGGGGGRRRPIKERLDTGLHEEKRVTKRFTHSPKLEKG